MTTAVITAMVVFMVSQAVRAIYASVKKERTMVREGESPLPTSVWVFLLIEVVIAPLATWGLATLAVPMVALMPDSLMWLSIFVVVIYMLSVTIARVLSVSVAWGVKVYMVRKYKKELKGKQEQEIADYLHAQITDKD